MKNLILAALVSLAFPVYAHEGAHGPEVTMAPQGGKLEKTANLFLELLKQDTAFKIFAYTHASMESETKTPLPPADVVLVAKKSTLIDGKTKKPVDFKLEPKDDHFVLNFKGGSHRYELKLVVSHKGKEEKPVKWQIEP